MSAQEHHLKTGGGDQYFESTKKLMTIDPEALVLFRNLKLRRQHRFILYTLTDDQLKMEHTGLPEARLPDLLSVLPESECRYAIYDHDLTTSDGRKTSKLYFISWLPTNAHPSMKMQYTHTKAMIRNSFDGCYDVNGASVEEIRRGIETNNMAIGDADDDEEDDNSEFEDD